MFATLAAQIGAVFMVSVCIFAFLKGDEPERFGAASYLVAWFLTLILQRDSGLAGAQLAFFFIDLVVLFILGALTWKYRRSWPAWACGFHLLAIMSHIMVLLGLTPPNAVFYTVSNLAGYGVLIAIAVGTFWAWQDRQAAGLE